MAWNSDLTGDARGLIVVFAHYYGDAIRYFLVELPIFVIEWALHVSRGRQDINQTNILVCLVDEKNHTARTEE